MLVPVDVHSVAYCALLPVFWPLFIVIYYIIPAYITPLVIKRCFKVSILDTGSMVIGGLWGFFFGLPFVHAFTDYVTLLFVISTRSLLIFVLASFVFQFLHAYNSSKLHVRQILLNLSIFTLLGYWLVCIAHYIFSYVFAIINTSIL